MGVGRAFVSFFISKKFFFFLYLSSLSIRWICILLYESLRGPDGDISLQFNGHGTNYFFLAILFLLLLSLPSWRSWVWITSCATCCMACTVADFKGYSLYISSFFASFLPLGLSSFTIILVWDFQVLYVVVKGSSKLEWFYRITTMRNWVTFIIIIIIMIYRFPKRSFPSDH